jgi:XTP/dITP diphosphohydrolase
LATHNQGKSNELRGLFRDVHVVLRTGSELGLPIPKETGETFEENAALKALAAMRKTGMISLSDDSGVEVHALGGQPGIHTADWAGPTRDFALARQQVHDRLSELGSRVSRRASYVCVLCLAKPDAGITTFRGQTEGVLVWPVRGELGSGFEPMFLPDGYAITYGEMTAEHRLRVNARAQAFRKLQAWLRVSDGTERPSRDTRTVRESGLRGSGNAE